MERKCYGCGQPGHLKKNCPQTKCYRCKRKGHIAAECPRREFREQNPPTPSRARSRPSSAASTSSDETFHGHSCLSKVKSRTASCTEDCCAPLLEKNSNIRADEAVARVAHVVEHLLKTEDEEKYFVFRNKPFSHFQNYGTCDQLFCLPVDDENLRRGDFDVVIVHPVYGYILIEVKATGDYCPKVPDTQKILVKTLRKALKTMEKGRQALGLLQPPRGARLNILTTLALPNTARAILCSTLSQEPSLLKGLAQCIIPDTANPGPMDVASVCLCSQDVPPKDETVEDASTLPSEWWSKFTERGKQGQRVSQPIFERAVNSFLRKEEVSSFPQLVAHTAARYRPLIHLTDQQRGAVDNPHPYVFVSGPPGSGKTLVLAEKCAQMLENREKVFLIYQLGRTTCHPAEEVLKNFIQQRLSTPSRLENLVPVGLAAEVDVNKLVETFIEDADRHRVRYEKETDEIKTPSAALLESEFASSAIRPLLNPDGEDRRQNLTEVHKGQGISIVIDELTRRTNKGKRMQLIGAVKRKLPRAKIWCAGPIPTHCPRGFQEERMPCSFRCPPSIQRILKAVEPFCQSDGSPAMFEYVTSCTSVPSDPSDAEEGYKLPCEGPEPFFLSHAGHKATEITDCRACSANLMKYLKHKLEVTKEDSSYVQEQNVLIVLTGTLTLNHMHALVHSELYRQLNTDFRVNIHDGAENDSYDLHAQGISIMHALNAGGLEREVVVFVPCQQYQGGSSRDSQPPDDDIQPPGGAAQSRSQQAVGKDAVAQRVPVAETLDKCRHITTEQKRALGRLGHLNLHWVWYVVSRSLSHAIIFHF